MTASMAAKPLEKHKPYLAFSSAAKLLSKAARVGLPVREYSNPL